MNEIEKGQLYEQLYWQLGGQLGGQLYEQLYWKLDGQVWSAQLGLQLNNQLYETAEQL